MICESTVEDVFFCLRIDGSEIVWPEQPEPLRRRGIMMNEIIMYCTYRYVHLTPVIPTWSGKPEGSERQYDANLPQWWINHMFHYNNGIVLGKTPTGKSHAVAWDAEQKLILDPNGTSYPRSQFDMECFWAKTN